MNNNILPSKIQFDDVVKNLREQNGEDFPAEFTSSHWKKYGPSVNVKLTEKGFSGKADGFEDLRNESRFLQLVRWVERLTYWPVVRKIPEFKKVWVRAREVLKSLNYPPNFYTFRSSVAATVLWSHLNKSGIVPETILIIGDGNGFLGALLKNLYPASTLFLVDFPKMLMFQADVHSRLARARGGRFIENVHFLPPGRIEDISEKIDLVVNVASMQEMTPKTIQYYFDFIRTRSNQKTLFYCVNRVEKIMPGGEASRFIDYPWLSSDEIFIDGPCDYYKHYILRGTSKNGPEILGFRMPWVHYFDGEMWHRLVRLSSPTG